MTHPAPDPAAMLSLVSHQLATPSTGDSSAMAEHFASMLVQLGRSLPPEGRANFRRVVERVLEELDRP